MNRYSMIPKKHTQGKIGSQHILPDHVSGVEFQTLLIVYENSKNKKAAAPRHMVKILKH